MPEWIVSTDEMAEEEQNWSWKSGSYRRFRRHISVALGNDPDTPHPFDVELTRVPPGEKPCPVHVHDNRWEFFIVVSGIGHVHRNGDIFNVKAGDCLMQPAKTRHRIFNASDKEDLVYYVIANECEDDTGDRVEP